MQSKNIVDLRKKSVSKKPVVIKPRTVFTAPKKVSPVRARRMRRYAILILLFFGIVGFGIYGFGVLSYKPVFNITKIEVVGNENISADMILQYAQSQLYDGTHPFFSPTTIFFYHRVGLEREISSNFPRIKSVSIGREILDVHTIKITITERHPYALWCNESLCYNMDNAGYVYAEAPYRVDASTSIPILTDASSTPEMTETPYFFGGSLIASSSPIGQIFISAHLTAVVAYLRELKNIGLNPLGVFIEGEQDFSVKLSDGYHIKASFGEDTLSLMKNLQLILNSDPIVGKTAQLNYIDLRFGDRVYYKMKEGIKVATTTIKVKR